MITFTCRVLYCVHSASCLKQDSFFDVDEMVYLTNLLQ